MESQEKKTIDLETGILIRECSNGNKRKEDIYYDFRIGNRALIHDVFKYQKFNYDFCDKISCYNTGEYVIGYLRPSYTDFLESIIKLLNCSVEDDYQDDEDLTRKLLERVEVLKNIKTMKELKKEFPYLYKDILAGRRYIRDLEKLESLDNDKSKYKNAKKYYYSCALKRRLDRFIETQAVQYDRFINKRFEYKKLTEEKDYNNYFEKYFDINKVALYAIYKYLKICENTTSTATLRKYIKLIEKYLESTYDKSVSIKINDEIIDINYIKAKIYDLREEIKKTESETEWVLVPPSYNMVTGNKDSSKVTIFNYKELERLRKKGNRKTEFYENSSYLLKVKGSNKYRGYSAYIYPNGEVLLDVEYNDNYPSTAIGDALYNIKAIDFLTLSKLDKKTLKNNPKAKWIIHSKYWEKKASEIINRTNTKEDEEAAKKLVKSLKKE